MTTRQAAQVHRASRFTVCVVGPISRLLRNFALALIPITEGTPAVQETKVVIMNAPDTSATIFRVSDLSQTRPTQFSLVPSAEQMTALAHELDLSALRKLRFEGEITAQGKTDWRLKARLGATVVQPCVATLEPVSTRIDEVIERIYLADFEEPDGAEVEMPEDDTIEPLPAEIDLNAVMAEALALNIPAYPRADGSEIGTTVFTEPGKEPLRDEDLRPFSGLAELRDKLAKKDE